MVVRSSVVSRRLGGDDEGASLGRRAIIQTLRKSELVKSCGQI